MYACARRRQRRQHHHHRLHYAHSPAAAIAVGARVLRRWARKLLIVRLRMRMSARSFAAHAHIRSASTM
jgi:hypothetical protein